MRRDEIIQAMEERILKLEPLEQRDLDAKKLDTITECDIMISSYPSPPPSAKKELLTTPQKASPEAIVFQSSQKKQLTANKADKRMMDRLRWELESYKQECEYYHQ